MPLTTRSLQALSACALAAASVTLALPAQAAAHRTVDDRGDIAQGVDLRSALLVNEKNVRVALQHRNLVRSSVTAPAVSVWLDTDPDTRGPDFLFTGGVFTGTDYVLLPSTGWKVSQDATPVSCDYAMHLDYGKDRTRIRMARACLGKPGDVRIAVKAAALDADGVASRDWLVGRRALTDWVSRG